MEGLENNIQNNSETNRDALKGWTKDEKFYLLLAIKSYGSYDYERIREYITTKSVDEIKAALDYFRSIAHQDPVCEEKRKIEKTKYSRKPRVPLTSWAKLLQDSLNFNELHTETATAVRLIAELEDLPAPVCTDSIDFKEVYHQLANALEGKPVLPDLITTAILNKCVTETALSSKAFIKTSAFKYVLNSIDMSDKEINKFPRPTENQELALIRHLAAQRSYNPLNVPEDYLKPSFESPYDESMQKNVK